MTPCRCSVCARNRRLRAERWGRVVVYVAVLLGLATFAACVAAICRGMPE